MASSGVEQTREAILFAPIPAGLSGAEWTELSGVRLSELEKTPAAGAEFEDAPQRRRGLKNYAAWEKDFRQAIVAESAPASLPLSPV